MKPVSEKRSRCFRLYFLRQAKFGLFVQPEDGIPGNIMRFEPSEITAIVFLDKLQSFAASKQDKLNWTLAKQKQHPPSYVKLQQLDSLLKVFTPEIYQKDNFPHCFDAVLTGKFLMSRDLNIYSGIFSEMDAEIAAQPYIPEKHGEWDEFYLRHNFTDLLQFRNSVEMVRSHNSGIAEISYHYLYSVAVSEEFIRQMNLKKVDDFLWKVIDPQQRIFSKEQLVADYGYPDDDLDELELDFW